MDDLNHVSIAPFSSTRFERIFTVHFLNRDIHTTVTNRVAILCRWLKRSCRLLYKLRCHLRIQRPTVGLGIQWRPKFTRNDPDPPRIATIQLSFLNRCIIFQILRLRANSVPRMLYRFLADVNINFAGYNIANDCRMLGRDRRLRVVNQVEIRDIAERRLRWPNASLHDIAYWILGTEAVGVAKPEYVGRSNWNVPVLSHAQILYACVDAQASYRIAIAGNRRHD